MYHLFLKTSRATSANRTLAQRLKAGRGLRHGWVSRNPPKHIHDHFGRRLEVHVAGELEAPHPRRLQLLHLLPGERRAPPHQPLPVTRAGVLRGAWASNARCRFIGQRVTAQLF